MPSSNASSQHLHAVPEGDSASLPALLGLAELPGQALPANRPLLMEGAQRAWWVAGGKVDVFMVRAVDGRPAGRRYPVARVAQGGIFLGLEFARDCPDWLVLAIGSPQTVVVEIKRAALQRHLSSPDTAGATQILSHVEQWLLALCDGLESELPPQDAIALQRPATPATITLEPGQVGLVRSGVVWLQALQGAPLLAGDPKWRLVPLAAPLALPRHTWVQATDTASALHVIPDGAPLLAADPDWGAVRRLQRLTLFRWVERFQAQSRTDQARLQESKKAEQQTLRSALRGLSATIKPQSGAVSADPNSSALFQACTLIGQHAGIEFVQHPDARRGVRQRDPLGDILQASQVRWRDVKLEGRWWQCDSGHLLAFDASDGRPLALIAQRSGKAYDLHDSTHQSVTRLDAQRASQLAPMAKTFYRPFRTSALNLRDLMDFATAGYFRDVLFIGALSLLIGLLGLLMPWATGQLIDSVIPHADRSQLGLLAGGLVSVMLATSLLGLSQSFAQQRIEIKMDTTVQSAVWDRLLKLPVPFFRNYSAGDLASRANGITAIRQALSGTTLRSVLSALFSLWSVALMMAQDVPLTLVGIALVALVVVASAVGSALALRHERHLTEMGGRLSGLLLQLLAGINKVRAAGAEGRAFAQWAQSNARMGKSRAQAARIRLILNVMVSAYPLLASISIFSCMAVWQMAPGLSTGQFLVFNAAFGMLLGSMLTLSGTVMGLLNLIPLYERAKPILHTPPEVDAAKTDPGTLDGRIDLTHVVFGYHPDLPPIIRGLSLSVQAGEFVAIVGPSGSGKSTLLRLLLGFEQPQQGSIVYSDRDLSTVDLTAVRRQLGVVLQNGQLMEGDIFSNIVGSRPLGKEAAEAAIDQSGLRADLAAMPMGMHTLLGDRGATLSGGQRQRLQIARAIVHKPRIVFLDEATSALDHHSQQHVMRSFEQLQATRLVIAHRLSTVINADRILVMQDGQVVEQGTYAELMQRNGLFTSLAQRQMA